MVSKINKLYKLKTIHLIGASIGPYRFNSSTKLLDFQKVQQKEVLNSNKVWQVELIKGESLFLSKTIFFEPGHEFHRK